MKDPIADFTPETPMELYLLNEVKRLRTENRILRPPYIEPFNINEIHLSSQLEFDVIHLYPQARLISLITSTGRLKLVLEANSDERKRKTWTVYVDRAQITEQQAARLAIDLYRNTLQAITESLIK